MEQADRRIVGYRELSQAEIDLMNRIKAKGAELLALHDELYQHLIVAATQKSQSASFNAAEHIEAAKAEYARFLAAEPHRWAAIGKTDIQTGVMALVRAVAQNGI